MKSDLMWMWDKKLVPIQKLTNNQIEQIIVFLNSTKKQNFNGTYKQKWLKIFRNLKLENERRDYEECLNFVAKRREQKIINAVDKFIATVFPKDFEVLKKIN